MKLGIVWFHNRVESHSLHPIGLLAAASRDLYLCNAMVLHGHLASWPRRSRLQGLIADSDY